MRDDEPGPDLGLSASSLQLYIIRPGLGVFGHFDRNSGRIGLLVLGVDGRSLGWGRAYWRRLLGHTQRVHAHLVPPERGTVAAVCGQGVGPVRANEAERTLLRVVSLTR